MKKQETRALVETGILVGVAVVLDIIFGYIYSLPYGGSISIAMLPIFVLSARRGLKHGLLGGVLFGLISFIFKPYFLNFLQFGLDYILAFGVLGLGALLKDTKNKLSKFVYLMLIGSALRYLMATLAGVAYWAEYIPDEMAWFDSVFGTSIATTLSGNALVFFGSFIYNGLYMIPSALLCVLIGIILHNRSILKYGLEVNN